MVELGYTFTMPIQDNLVDEFTAHQISVLRFSASERKEALRILVNTEKEIVRLLTRHDPTEPVRTVFQRKRLQVLQKEINTAIAEGYTAIKGSQSKQLNRLAGFAAERTVDIVNTEVSARVLTVGVTTEQLRTLTSDTLVMGAPTRELWTRESQVVQRAFRDQMRTGITINETLGQLIRRVTGTPALARTDGIFHARKRAAEMLIRTSSLSVNNAAQNAVYEANTKLLRGRQALATLDFRTSEICLARSGSAWDMTGKPLPESLRKEPFPGPPAWHIGCRSVLVPIVKRFNELSRNASIRGKKDLLSFPPATRASIDGEISDDITMDMFLRRQVKKGKKSNIVQQLGAGKFKLWEEGKIELSQLIDMRGRPLTLEQLQRAA